MKTDKTATAKATPFPHLEDVVWLLYRNRICKNTKRARALAMQYGPGYIFAPSLSDVEGIIMPNSPVNRLRMSTIRRFFVVWKENGTVYLYDGENHGKQEKRQLAKRKKADACWDAPTKAEFFEEIRSTIQQKRDLSFYARAATHEPARVIKADKYGCSENTLPARPGKKRQGQGKCVSLEALIERGRDRYPTQKPYTGRPMTTIIIPRISE